MTDTKLVEFAATRVMGWEVVKAITPTCILVRRPGVGDYSWSPLTSLDDAWMLVEKIAENFGDDCEEKHDVWSNFQDAFYHCIRNITLLNVAEAACEITMAALEAVGAETERS